MQLANGICAWGLSPSKYFAQAAKNCEKHLTNKLHSHFQLPLWPDNLFPHDYSPELDLSDPLNPECLSFYQHLIGVMRWMIELVCTDITTEVSFLSSHLAYPCKGHLETVLHMVAYLQQKYYTQLIFYLTYPKSTWIHFHSLIGPNFMAMLRRKSLWTCLSPWEETLMSAWCVTVTIQWQKDQMLLHWLPNLLWYGFNRLGFQEIGNHWDLCIWCFITTESRSRKDFTLSFGCAQ